MINENNGNNSAHTARERTDGRNRMHVGYDN